MRTFETIEDLRIALLEFRDTYYTTWLGKASSPIGSLTMTEGKDDFVLFTQHVNSILGGRRPRREANSCGRNEPSHLRTAAALRDFQAMAQARHSFGGGDVESKQCRLTRSRRSEAGAPEHRILEDCRTTCNV